MQKRYTYFFLLLFLPLLSLAQQAGIEGYVKLEGEAAAYASVQIKEAKKGTTTDEAGFFSIENLAAGNYTLHVSLVGSEPLIETIRLAQAEKKVLSLSLKADLSLDEVVITGTLKEVRRIDSPVPVEVYSPAFFQKNPTPSIFDALQNINGVRPQLNCNICNTGDIHINGLEGPYSMVLIDGMPIVSSLATVYGLSGIPNSLVERVEIVKGPASSLYGSEAVGGLINIITKQAECAPKVSADLMATSWQEYNADLGLRLNLGKKVNVLTGANYFLYDTPHDHNQDNFTDVTLQERVSVFQKWHFARKDDRLFSLAGRFFHENRWGGELDWTPAYRGGEEIYGESIYTRRWELIGSYQLPLKEKLLLSFSYNDHDQNSVYGTTPFLAQQRIAFGQLTWDKKVGKHDLLAGTALRYTFYDDNTSATEISALRNQPSRIWLPGLFVQDEIALYPRHKLLLGMRYDYNSVHGNIYTPRLAYKWTLPRQGVLRLNAGSGFRIINLFTEEHAALTGAREVMVEEALDPERSYNVNLNYLKKIYTQGGGFVGLDVSAWYTYFNNLIFPDYETNPNQILYRNLDGHAVTTGISANLDLNLPNGLKLLAGATLMDVSSVTDGVRKRQLLTERFTATWSASYTLPGVPLDIDYTGNLYGPMKLPLLGPLDPRQPYSPVWSIQNVQLTWRGWKGLELYGGVKNLLNWTPDKGNPFLIARSNDPFDRNVLFDAQGQVVPTADNPYALTFDPTYVYAPNQGIRGFLGVRVVVQ